MKQMFSIRSILEDSWVHFKKHPWLFIGVQLFVGLSAGLAGRVQEEIPFPLNLLTFPLYWLLVVWLGLGMIRFVLDFVEGDAPQFGRLFSQGNRILSGIGGGILYSLILLGGFFLLFVPGIVWTLQFGQYRILIVEQGLGPVAALKASSALTRGYKKKLFFFSFAIVGLNLLGALCLGVGLFVTLPLTAISTILIFKSMQAQSTSPARILE